jgi:hypothetical protein
MEVKKLMEKIAPLRPDEINVKPKQVVKNKNGKVSVLLLLYKDSRCDMARLDEAFGANNWQRLHQLIGESLYCTVSVWDAEKGQWVHKQDVGSESDIEKEKGQSSDSFKRACTNWGIGRELYTAPKRTFVELAEGEFYEVGGKLKMSNWIEFHVSKITYDEERSISSLEIVDGNGNARFRFPSSQKKETVAFVGRKDAMDFMARCKKTGIERHVTKALEERRLDGLSQLRLDEVDEFYADVVSVSRREK